MVQKMTQIATDRYPVYLFSKSHQKDTLRTISLNPPPPSVFSRLDYYNSLVYGDGNLTSLGFSAFWTDWPTWRQNLFHFTRSPPFTLLFPSLAASKVSWEYCLRSICWSAHPGCEKSLLIFTPCLPHRFHPTHWDQTMVIVCQSLGSRLTQVQELSTLVSHLFGTTCSCLSIHLYQLLPLRNIWRHTTLTWSFSHRYWHARWPVDVTELFPRFWFWTQIRLSRHWAWLCWGYWRYRNLIDWLTEVFSRLSVLTDLSPSHDVTGNVNDIINRHADGSLRSGIFCHRCINIVWPVVTLWVKGKSKSEVNLQERSYNGLGHITSFGPHRTSRKIPWHSPDGKTHNQIEMAEKGKVSRSG